ncbi:hypothetical protein EDD57_1812 [Baia soyae]|uniref:Uncharacterized protein n=2 Tax=Baia soyae TaxID=1544746 RepID=A0A4R2RDE4_9BACL|nr:hypothetical protein EDD57_1812 [Baia soyae]
MEKGVRKMYDPKKGKYTEEENTHIIEAINKGSAVGKRDRDLLKQISLDLNRGYAGIMSHVRKLRAENPNRFIHTDGDPTTFRLNSWDEEEENLVIDTVNRSLKEGKSLSTAIAELESKLSRTQGAIYQRIYTLRRKNPEKFSFIPEQRPRKRRQLQDWQLNRATIQKAHPSFEEALILKTFEDRYGLSTPATKDQLVRLMRQYGCTRVSIALLTLEEDKNFPNIVADFLSSRLQHRHFL